MKIFIEYDNDSLSKIANQLYTLFKNNNYDVTLLDNNLSLNNKINIIKNNTNAFILSNKKNSGNLMEIIYPLRDNNTLATQLNNALSQNVSKFYQLRSPVNTNLDYYELLRPINNNDAILIKYGNISDNLANKIFQTISSFLNNKNIYTVKSGDSLYAISKKFNTTVDELKKVNDLTNNNLSIGQKLIIPNQSTSIINTNNNTYIVKSGDSLYALSKKFDTTVDELKKINNLTSNLLSIGQTLIIPNSETNTYIVQKGDSLYSISKKFNTTVDKIMKDNNLSSNLLSIGQKLIIKK